MKKLIFLSILILYNNNVRAQDSNAALAVGGLLAVGSGIAAVKLMEEKLELSGTEWILNNREDLSNFNLELMSISSKKISDFSRTSVVVFKVQELNMDYIPPAIKGKRRVLFCFTSSGWVTNYGIDLSKISWFLLDENEWLNMLVSYVKVASSNKDEVLIRKLLPMAQIERKGIKVKKKVVFPFYKIGGDSYLVSDYSDEMKLIYNEKSLGIFLKKTKKLVQLKRSSLREIHHFLFRGKKKIFKAF